MTVESRIRVLAVVLATLISGSWCGISAQNPATPSGKAVASNLSSSSTEAKAPNANSAGAEGASADAKTEPSVPDPSIPGTKVPSDRTAATSKAKDDSYIVGIADSLFVSVWKKPDFSGPVVVRPDGIITVAVVGDVHVAGLTTRQVQELLTEKLKNVVTEPQVTVVVREIRSRKVYLVGKVGRPGTVSLTGHETVLQVVAEAGGPNQFAKPDKMYVLRTTGDHEKRIQFNYKKVLAGSQPDLELAVGDIIVVP